jgi:hypothetical protein
MISSKSNARKSLRAEDVVADVPVLNTLPATTEQPVDTDTVVTEVVAAKPDPFADLPIVTIDEYSYKDLTDANTSDPRKYTGVQATAREFRLPIKKDWKHTTAMFSIGSRAKEFRSTSVYGTIQQIVANSGRSGIPAFELVNRVRQAQIGNKRSHYCDGLPPIGWAEGWIDSFVSKGFAKVMEKKAPALYTAPVASETSVEEVTQEAKAA